MNTKKEYEAYLAEIELECAVYENQARNKFRNATKQELAQEEELRLRAIYPNYPNRDKWVETPNQLRCELGILQNLICDCKYCA